MYLTFFPISNFISYRYLWSLAVYMFIICSFRCFVFICFVCLFSIFNDIFWMLNSSAFLFETNVIEKDLLF